MYFDMTAMPMPDQLRALSAARKFIKTQMAAPDLMAIMEYNGAAVKVLDDFTDDKDELLKTIETLIVGEGNGFDETNADESAADTGAAFGQDDAEFNIFNTDRQLAALQTAVRMLAPLNEKKSFVYFASGLRLNGINNQAQMQATVNAAIRGNVAFYPIDARGLVASAPAWRCHHRLAWRRRDVQRQLRPGQCRQSAAHAGHALHSWPPIPAAKRCSTTTTSRPAS